MGSTARVRVVVQARMTSTRLPGKSLLPLGGVPLAVLVLRRATNTGREAVLATSSESSDDELASTVAAAGFDVMRGSRLDVLSRFLDATADLDDDDVVVRLTADNPVPDGELIDTLVGRLHTDDLEYVHIDQDAVPYGLSAEAFTARALRSVASSGDPADREHVTVSLRRRTTAAPFRLGLPAGLRHGLRCTVDSPEDHTAMAAVFDGRTDAGWRELIGALS